MAASSQGTSAEHPQPRACWLRRRLCLRPRAHRAAPSEASPPPLPPPSLSMGLWPGSAGGRRAAHRQASPAACELTQGSGDWSVVTVTSHAIDAAVSGSTMVRRQSSARNAGRVLWIKMGLTALSASSSRRRAPHSRPTRERAAPDRRRSQLQHVRFNMQHQHATGLT